MREGVEWKSSHSQWAAKRGTSDEPAPRTRCRAGRNDAPNALSAQRPTREAGHVAPRLGILVVARAGTMASSSSLARTSPTLARRRARSSPSSSSSSSSRRAARRRATTTTPRASSAPLGTPLSPPTEIDRALFGDGAYAPSPMDASTMQSQGVVLLVVGIMTAYWWYVLVPGARVNLAVNKKSGRLRAYLEDLKTDDGRKLERFFYAKWLAKVDPETRYLLRDEPDGEGEAGEVAAKTMLSDTEGVTRDVGEESVEEIVRRAKRTPKFWSGDNPVLVGAALSIGAAGLFGVIPH